MADKHEEKAAAGGWVPKEEWVEQGKPEEDWVEAKEFNLRGELMGRISQQTKDLKALQESTRKRDERLSQLTKALHALGEQNKKLAQKRIQEERDELGRIKAEAIIAQDAETVADIEKDLRELDQQEKELETEETASAGDAATEDEGGMTPEQQALWNQWVKDNPWYVTDVRAQQYANFVAATTNSEGKDFAELLEEVAQAVDQVFNLDDGEEEDDVPKRRGAVMDTPKKGASPSRKKGGNPASRLTESQKEIGQTFVEEGLFDNLGEYAKQLQELGELGG